MTKVVRTGTKNQWKKTGHVVIIHPHWNTGGGAGGALQPRERTA